MFKQILSRRADLRDFTRIIFCRRRRRHDFDSDLMPSRDCQRILSQLVSPRLDSKRLASTTNDFSCARSDDLMAKFPTTTTTRHERLRICSLRTRVYANMPAISLFPARSLSLPFLASFGQARVEISNETSSSSFFDKKSLHHHLFLTNEDF